MVKLHAIQDSVLGRMGGLPGWRPEHISRLEQIPLKLLRRNAVYRHGVTRFRPRDEWPAEHACPGAVREVGLHRELLGDEWREYGEMVLYHEYVHCIGLIAHDSAFHARECLWPGHEAKQDLAHRFMDSMVERNHRWLWCCPGCGSEARRQRKANGRYLCRRCGLRLLDRAANGAQTET